VIFLIGLSGVIWLLKGNPSSTSFAAGWNPFQGEHLTLGLPANLTFFSFAILALLGIETPLNMGVEVNGGEKAIRTFLFWGSIIVMAAYLWATWGNMVVIEAGGANGTTGGAETVGLAIGKGAGAIVSIVMAWVFLTVAVVYNYSFGRLLFVSGLEKRLPHQFGKVNRNKVPANAITLQTAISTVLTIFVFFIVGRGDADPYKAFYVLYAGVTIVWCISTALLFLDIFFAKRAEPERFERERRISLGWLYLCGAAGFVVNVLAVMFIGGHEVIAGRMTGGDVISGLLSTSSAPVWNSGLTALKTANNGVYNSVLTNVGARPTDRDSVDKRMVSDVKNRTGRIINIGSTNAERMPFPGGSALGVW
jgi:amino acid transporter